MCYPHSYDAHKICKNIVLLTPQPGSHEDFLQGNMTTNTSQVYSVGQPLDNWAGWRESFWPKPWLAKPLRWQVSSFATLQGLIALFLTRWQLWGSTTSFWSTQTASCSLLLHTQDAGRIKSLVSSKNTSFHRIRISLLGLPRIDTNRTWDVWKK